MGNQVNRYEGYYTIQSQHGTFLDNTCILIDHKTKRWICDTYDSLLNCLSFFGSFEKAQSALNYLNRLNELAKFDLQLKIVPVTEECFKENTEGFEYMKPISKETFKETYILYKQLNTDYREIKFFIMNEKGQYVSIYGICDKLDFKCRWFSKWQRAEEVLKILKRQYPDMQLEIVEKFEDEI